MLTGVNLLLRFAGTSFQVYLSRRIGESGIGLLQLVMSVGNLAMVAAIAGIRTATMYLTAEEIGKNRPENVAHILSGCFLYSILFSSCVSIALYTLAPWLATRCIGNSMTLHSLRLFAAFLPVVCLCGVMSGYFTAANRIGTLAAVEVAEQVFSMATTLAALTLWAGADAERACISVVLGSSLGACVTLSALVILRFLEHPSRGSSIPIKSRLLHAALPLAAADVVRSAIGTTENLLVPKRLALYPGETSPLSAFGRVSGMVFPVMMFPACILFALAELLIPELARCNASGKKDRIQYLVQRCLWVAMLYGIFFGGLIFLLAVPLCSLLYNNSDAGSTLRAFSLMIPFLYCDAITDAMTKGLGQQKICVRYNILTSAMDVFFLFFLLPRYGMRGYYFSFLTTHLLNFALSLRRLCLITGYHVPFYSPALAASAAILAVWSAHLFHCQIIYFPTIVGLFYCFGIVRKRDIKWIRSVILNSVPLSKA